MSTDTLVAFTPPTREFVEHALRELDYAERLTGYKMTPSAGNSSVDLYSLAETVLFVLGTRWDAPLFDPSFKSGINWIDMARLTEWVRDVIGDVELAQAIERDVLPLESFHAQVTALGETVAPRMEQYRLVRDPAPDAGDAEAGQASED